MSAPIFMLRSLPIYLRTFVCFALLPCITVIASIEGPRDFRPLIDAAVTEKRDHVVIPPGTYRLKPIGKSKSHVVLRGVENMVINATGVTLICEELTQAVTFEHCRNVTLRGLTVDYDPLPFTQGTVVSVADDASSINIALHTGYPREAYSRIDLCDPKTRTRKRGMPFLWGARAELLPPGTVRVSLPDIGKSATSGDLVSLSTGPKEGGSAHAVSIYACAGMIFEDVTVFSAPGFGIIESDGEGGMRYTGCRVVPGPKPASATEERLLSSSWDAMQSKTMRRGPLVENCEIRDAGDDSWSVQSSDFLVVGVDGSRVTLAFRDIYCDGPQVGDHLTTALNAPKAVITRKDPSSLTRLDPAVQKRIREASPWTLWRVGPKTIEVTVKGEHPFSVGDSVYCPERQGNGFVFRNNRIHSPGRILIKAGEGLIENNTVLDAHSGVTVCPEVPGDAAMGIRNLVIRGNRFTGTGYFCPSPWSTQAGSISITAGASGREFRGPEIFENMVIENNRFEDINGPAIVLSSARKVTIKDNTFRAVMRTKSNDTGAHYGIDANTLLWIATSESIEVGGNRVFEPGPFLKKTTAGTAIAADTLARIAAGITQEPSTP